MMTCKVLLLSWLILYSALPTLGKESEKKERSKLCDWKDWAWALPIVGGGAAVAVAPLALAAAGFTTAGIAAGSLAASLQGAGLLGGTTMAALQSAGAAGLGWLGSAGLFGAGTWGGMMAAFSLNCDESVKADPTEYQKIKESMKQLVESKSKENGLDKVILTENERGMLLLAYENLVGVKIQSWRELKAAEEHLQGNEQTSKVVNNERSQLQVEIKELCREVIDLIDKYLLPSEDTVTAVFFNKMKGDYYRYQVEMSVGAERKILISYSKAAYTLAYDLAEDMSPVHPTKLSLVISLSAFYYEIEGNRPTACQFTQRMFNQAKDKHSVNKEDFETTSLLLEIIQANMNKWCSETEKQEM